MAIVFQSTESQIKSRPRLPHGFRIYAIGDIHGRADLLGSVLERIDENLSAHPISVPIEIFLGDYIDRGPGSREVLDQLINRGRSSQTVFLKGNHETFIATFTSDPSTIEDWRHFGGFETLMSYDIDPIHGADAATQAKLAATFAEALPFSHYQFLENLKLSYTCGDFFFAHAGIRPGVPLAMQREEDLLWIRQEFLISKEQFSKVVVHGHTPVQQPDIRPNRINIDTGAYATGRLTCLVIEGDEIYFI